MRWFVLAVLMALTPVHPAVAAPTPGTGSSAAPAPTTYQVNVIVFQNRQSGLGGKEQWAQEHYPPIGGLVRAVPPVTGLSTGSSLAPALATLSQNPNYTVLAAVNWIQPGIGPDQAVPIRVQNPQGNLDGTIVVYELQYLHADLDLAFSPGGTIAGTVAEPNAAVGTSVVNGLSSASGATVYRLIEHRRIRPKETEYFDHPKFGVLLRVTPLVSSPPQ